VDALCWGLTKEISPLIGPTEMPELSQGRKPKGIQRGHIER